MNAFIEGILLLVKVTYFCLESFVRFFVPAPKKDIRGQNVLVTGGARGIGRELAIKFSQHGAKIALWDLDKAGLADTAEDLKMRGVTVYTYQCDVTDRHSVVTCAKELRDDMGDVDILVNNAGVLVGKPFMDLEEGDIRKTFDVNVIAHFWTIKEFLPSMLERRHGHIVTVASMAAKTGAPLLTDYCASKFAAVGLMEALRTELYTMDHHCPIETTAICPVFVNTKLIHGEEISKRMQRRDRFGILLIEPEEVAEAAVTGVLRNKKEVYVPAVVGLGDLSRVILPVKASLAINDFIDARFVAVKNQD